MRCSAGKKRHLRSKFLPSSRKKAINSTQKSWQIYRLLTKLLVTSLNQKCASFLYLADTYILVSGFQQRQSFSTIIWDLASYGTLLYEEVLSCQSNLALEFFACFPCMQIKINLRNEYKLKKQRSAILRISYQLARGYIFTSKNASLLTMFKCR